MRGRPITGVLCGRHTKGRAFDRTQGALKTVARRSTTPENLTIYLSLLIDVSRGRRIENGEGLRLGLRILSSARGCMSLTSVSSASGGDIIKVGGLSSVGSIITEGLGLSGCFQSCFSLSAMGVPPMALVKASICCESLSVCMSLL